MNERTISQWAQLLGVASMIIGGLVPSRAVACSCAPSPPPCEAVGWSKLVFLGTVIEVSTGKQVKLAKMHVDHAFKGTLGETVDLFDDGMCNGPLLEIGRQYLMYTSPFGPGPVPARGCTRSRGVDQADEDLEFLRQYEAGNVNTHVSGTVRFRPDEPEDSRLGEEGRPPLAGVNVILSGAAGELQTKTDSKGRYAFSGLPTGDYRIEVQLAGHRVNWVPNDMTLHPSGCAIADLLMKVDRRVQGFVRDREGAPVVGALVEMKPVDPKTKPWQRPILLDVSADNGTYVIDGIPPGEYLLGVNITHTPTKAHPYPPTYFPEGNDPTQATPVRIGKEVSVQEMDLEIDERLPLVVVQGQILNADGKPPKAEDHPEVRIREPDLYRQIEDTRLRIDSNGRFQIELFEGVRYSAFAFSDRESEKRYSAPLEFVPTKENHKLELILNKTSEEFNQLVARIEIP